MKSKDYFIAKLERNGINLVACGHSASDFHVLGRGHHLCLSRHCHLAAHANEQVTQC
jgi:hypothetical protein